MDVFEEALELSEEQHARVDEIYDAVFEMSKVLTENSNLEGDMYYIDDIADYASNVLCLFGYDALSCNHNRGRWKAPH